MSYLGDEKAKGNGTDWNEGGEECYDEESEEDSDQERDDEDEPTLRYARIERSVPEALKKDSTSAISVSDNWIAHIQATCISRTLKAKRRPERIGCLQNLSLRCISSQLRLSSSHFLIHNRTKNSCSFGATTASISTF